MTALVIIILMAAAPATYPVTRIIDGDTIEVATQYGNLEKKEIVRLVGVDAPEKDAPYAAESKGWLTNLLSGETVTLTFDDSEVPVRDRYGRILAYIYREECDVCAESIRQGYAKAWRGKYGRRPEFIETERVAQDKSKGLWRD